MDDPREPWSFLYHVPIVGQLARGIARVRAWKVGRVPVGLLVLLPVALVVDIIDAFDEFFVGPVGMVASLLIETTYILGLLGRPAWAVGVAGIDLVPGLDVLPFSTALTLREAWREWKGYTVHRTPKGPVIDV